MTGLGWSCRACGSTSESDREGRAQFCRDCKNARGIYTTTQGNLRSGFNRTNKGSPYLGFSIDQFCIWRKAQVLRCVYCCISEGDLSAVGMRSQIQRIVRVLGVDRLDSGKGYVLDNLAPCCFVCNQIKGDRFTANEMAVIGPAVGEIWAARLAGYLPEREYEQSVEESQDGLNID